MEVVAIHPDIKKRIAKLPREVEARVLKLIGLLEVEEYHITMPFSKKVEKDLYELRELGEHNISRTYAFWQIWVFSPLSFQRRLESRPILHTLDSPFQGNDSQKAETA